MKASSRRTQVYFDCNATTPVLSSAASAALEAMRTLYGNPSSSHLVGLQAKHILESTRGIAARVVGADPEQIIFTSGATEAIQTAVFSALQFHKDHPHLQKTKLLYGATEHKVIPQALHHWVKALSLPFEVVELPVDEKGQIKIDYLRQELPKAALLCTMAVNNETGVIQNLDAIEKTLNESASSVLWLVDCVQALGKTELKLNTHRIDYAAFSGHKLYAPKGIGFLYVRKNAPLVPLIVGGGQEKGFRSGTENLPGVAALGAVLEQLLNPQKSDFQSHDRLVGFRQRLVDEMKKVFPKVEFNTPFENSVPTTLNFSVPGLSSGELLDLFDSAGLRLSAGSACSSGSAKPSHVLDAMGIPHSRSASALRLSFGPCTTEAEIEKGCQLLRQCAIALKSTCLLDISGSFEAPSNLRDGIIQFRAASTNSWILADRDTRSCIIIDPCETVAERMEHYIRCQNLAILAILDTHSHADHESIRPLLQKILAKQFKNGTDQSFDSLGWLTEGSKGIESVQLDDGTKVPAIRISSGPQGDLVLASLKTPGHTIDSQTYLFGFAKSGLLKKEEIRFAFSGDTILSGGLGRTNFSASDPEGLFQSLRHLQSVLSPSTLLCPSHDYNQSFATSLKTEVAENSLLSLALGPMTPMTLEQFLSRKRQIDQELAQLETEFQGVVCGVTQVSGASCDSALLITAGHLKDYLQNHSRSPLIIDVRETQEFTLFKDWKTIGLAEAPRNVPLSRFVNFINELLRERTPDSEILLICRTGGRSLQAAKSLRRLGFPLARSLEGGLALNCPPQMS